PRPRLLRRRRLSLLPWPMTRPRPTTRLPSPRPPRPARSALPPRPRRRPRPPAATPPPPDPAALTPPAAAARGGCRPAPAILHARKKRKATLERTKGFRGEANSNYKRAKEALMKADAYAYRDRRNRKRDFRRLWITRINAAARQNGMTYGQFIHGLQLAGVELDRKVLADIAVRDPETFTRFAETAREAAAA